jgi:hypothetical protein
MTEHDIKPGQRWRLKHSRSYLTDKEIIVLGLSEKDDEMFNVLFLYTLRFAKRNRIVILNAYQLIK